MVSHEEQTLWYQTTTDKNFWYCQDCHDLEEPAMHAMVSVLVTPNHKCFKCKKPWFTNYAAKRMYVHEEFCFVENPPPYMEKCALCGIKAGKYWSPEKEIRWFYCPCKDCGEELVHHQMTSFCERCQGSQCPKCGTI